MSSSDWLKWLREDVEPRAFCKSIQKQQESVVNRPPYAVVMIDVEYWLRRLPEEVSTVGHLENHFINSFFCNVT